MHLLKKLLRRIARRGRPGHRPPDRWWDTVYGQYGAYAASGHPGVSEGANQRDFTVRWALLEGLLRRYGDPGRSRLLDAGCGNGLFTKRFVDLGYDVTATDFSPKALEQARARAGDAATWVQASLEEFRALEVYSQLCGETRLALLEHIPFDLPGAGHKRCFLVLGAMDATSPAQPHVKETV
jgi:SAM-dependent methyltransferase